MTSKDKAKQLLAEYIANQKSWIAEDFNDRIKKGKGAIESELGKTYVKEYIRVWQASLLTGSKHYNADKAWNTIKEKTGHEEYNNKYRQSYFTKNKLLIGSIAASIILAIIIARFYFHNQRIAKIEAAFTEYHVPYGSRSKITLPDGTNLWLNAGSTIKYSSDYNFKLREVMLEGEAFFDVEKMPEKPFYVRTGGATIRVLGTKFNLKAYPDEDIIETTVECGVVAVYNHDATNLESKKVILHANEQVSLLKKENSIYTDTSLTNQAWKERTKSTDSQIVLSDNMIINMHVNPDISSSWKEKEWIIDSEKLSYFSVKIERRFNVKIHFVDEQIEDYVFSGILKDENLVQMLEAISQTAPISYKIRDMDVYLSKRKTY